MESVLSLRDLGKSWSFRFGNGAEVFEVIGCNCAIGSPRSVIMIVSELA
jgi:hypothetical protein